MEVFYWVRFMLYYIMKLREKGRIDMSTEKDILFVIAFDGFRDEEYAEPKAVLEKAGYRVVTASTMIGVATGKLGMRVTVDLEYRGLSAVDYGAIVFIGGPGSPGYWEDDEAHRLLREAAGAEIVIGGICSASVTLAKAGVLRNKRATVWPGNADEFEPLVGNYTAASCERDGLVVTANGPGAADAFGRGLFAVLSRG